MNFEKEFYKEVAEKKRIARGIHNRASRGKGFKGPVRFPSDVLRGNDKKEYCKPGEVICVKIPKRDDMESVELQDRATMAVELLKVYDYGTISKVWGMTEQDTKQYLTRIVDQAAVEQREQEAAAKARLSAIPKRKDYLALSLKERYEKLEELLKEYTVRELAAVWFISYTSVYADKSRMKKQLEQERKEKITTKVPVKHQEKKKEPNVTSIQLNFTDQAHQLDRTIARTLGILDPTGTYQVSIQITHA